MNVAILLSGGKGLRLGTEIPKQYIKVKGKSIAEYSLDSIIASGKFEKVKIVCEPEYEKIFENVSDKACISFSQPGATRQLSIINALKDIEADENSKIEYVMVHDAARPLLSIALIEKIMGAVWGHDGVMPVLPMKDTVYECDEDGRISSLLNRDRIFAGQAPELFDFEKYLTACNVLDTADLEKIHGSSEPAILNGMDIVTVPGDEQNIKITTAEDLKRFTDLMG